MIEATQRAGDAGGDGRSAVCAILVTHNRKELLREALAALAAQTVPVSRIVVVDNASDDGTPKLVEREFPQVEVLRVTKNVGGAGGFHLGMKAALARECAWLWLMDDDTIVTPHALEELFSGRSRFPSPARPSLLASKVLWTDGSLHFMNPSLIKLPDLEALYASVECGTLSIRSTTFVSCLIQRELVTRYGLPIADYFIWGDDTEYTARVLRDNLGVMVPTSIAVHKTARKHTALDAPPERYYYHIRNMLWMITRSAAWTGKERLRLAVTLAAWIGRYFRRQGFALAGLRAVAAGIGAGLFSSPRELALDHLVLRQAAAPTARDLGV